MKRKNKSFSLLVILLSTFFQQASFGQTFQYSYPYFNITVPSLSELNNNQTNPAPYYTFFIETGNGRYKKVTDHIYGAYSNPPYTVPYIEAIPAGSTAMLNIIGHYDTIKPPRGQLRVQGIANSSLTLPPQANLPSNTKIGFDVSDSTVVIGDTMTLVITYKPDSVTKNVVAFYYNDNAGSGGNVFSVFTDPDQFYPFGDGTQNRIVWEKAIRTRNETASLSAASFPDNVSAALTGSNHSGFNNAVYFIPEAVNNSAERNIFISMATPKNDNLLGVTTNLKAVLIKYDKNNNIISMEPVNLALPVGQFASDPNGITTTPHCLSNLPGGPWGKTINYEISFRNIGNGPAKHIEVTVIIPEGIQFPPKNKFNLLMNLKVTSGGNEIDFQSTGFPNNYKKPWYNYKFVTSGGQRKIVFNLKNIFLPGTSSEPKDILKRSGKINFTLNTVAKDPQNPNALFPACMYSDVEIVFISALGNEEIRGSVIKGSDLVRNKCIYVSPVPPPCPRPAVVSGASYIPPKTQ